ncbi:MAG: TolC family protein [Verrucomicrobiota bacterium]|nr:TolC family protein [Verrucomicrobiota bacterium]
MNFLRYITGILLVVLCGCESEKYRQSADREVFGILNQRSQEVLGANANTNLVSSRTGNHPESVTPSGIIKERFADGGRTLTLPQALEMAEKNNRSYQLQRETLYLSALTLTGTRHKFAWSATSSVDLGIHRGTDGDLRGDSALSASVQKLFKTGARVTASLANDLVLYFDGKPKVPDLTLKLTQPLLRGAGAEMAAEVLTQAERDVVYAVRDYSHYQKTFSIETVTEYFRVLQSKDAVRNSYSNYLNLRKARDRAEAMAEAKRLPKYQVDQARQTELSARVKYLSAVESYRQELDEFKQRLSLPLGEALRLDDTALKDLVQAGLTSLVIDARRGYLVAVTNRLDVLNEVDQFEDAQRKVRVAANDLQPSLDIVVDASLTKQFYSSFSPEEFNNTSGLKLKLPLDQLSERNAYRASLINFEKQRRGLATELDGLRESIREGVRALERQQENYFIQTTALELAKQQVEVMPLLLQNGAADIRDQLEAQADLVEAQNDVTSALVNYHVARWNLLKNLGVMSVKGERFWLKKQGLSGDTSTNNPEETRNLPEVVPPGQVFGEPDADN